MFNEANKKQVLEMQDQFYSDRIGKVYGDFEVTRVWYDWETHKQMWELTCQKCGRKKVTHNGKDYAKGKNQGICGCETRKRIAAEKETARIKRENLPSNPKWIGQKIGCWEIIGYKTGFGWKTRCTFCGAENYHAPKFLLRENPMVCICQTNRGKFDIEKWRGVRKYHLTVVGKRKKMFVCRCDCGRSVEVNPVLFENGKIKSCGKADCIHHKSLISTHGLSKDRIYRIWSGMKERCYNHKNHAWKTYGGRGIDICDEWREDVFAFRDWALSHGYADNLSIDRIDNDKGYSSDNCRWADAKAQANNQHPKYTFTARPTEKRSRKRKLEWEINGETKSAIDWCEQYGLSFSFVSYRIKKMGMTPYEALTTPKVTAGRPKTTIS